MKPFVSTSTDPHVRDEENRWASFFTPENSYPGIILIYDHKLCAVAHEVKVGLNQNVIGLGNAMFHAQRLMVRTRRLVELLDDCGERIVARDCFILALTQLENNQRTDSQVYVALSTLPDAIHEYSHRLTDELYARFVK